MWSRGEWRIEKSYVKIKWKNPLMPFLYALKALGRLPFVKKETGRIEFRLVSLATVWTVAIMSVQFVIVVKMFLWRTSHEKYWTSFNQSLTSLRLLVFISTTFHGPIFNWANTVSIIDAVNSWNAFHVSFQKTIKKPISSVILRYSYISFIPACMPIYQLIIDMFHNEISLFVIVSNSIFITCIAYETTIFLSWIIFCLMVKTAADLLKESFMEMVTTIPSSYAFVTYRLLWTELHSRTIQFTQAFAKTLQAYLFVTIAHQVLNIYIILMFTFVDRSLTLDYALESIIHSIFCIWAVFSIGELAQKNIRDDFFSALYSHRWLHLSEKSRAELEIFLDMIRMGKPCFELTGWCVIGRVQLLPMIELVGTFLVVMMQLEVSTEHSI